MNLYHLMNLLSFFFHLIPDLGFLSFLFLYCKLRFLLSVARSGHPAGHSGDLCPTASASTARLPRTFLGFFDFNSIHAQKSIFIFTVVTFQQGTTVPTQQSVLTVDAKFCFPNFFVMLLLLNESGRLIGAESLAAEGVAGSALGGVPLQQTAPRLPGKSAGELPARNGRRRRLLRQRGPSRRRSLVFIACCWVVTN